MSKIFFNKEPKKSGNREKSFPEKPFGKFIKDKPKTSGNSSFQKKDIVKKPIPVKALLSNDDVPIRLNKYIATAGICSRREADHLIETGQIMVNGKAITALGTKVSRKDVVEFKGKKLSGEKLVYILLNKPKDFITTLDDPEGRRTVMELVRNACKERIFPVGRLDRNTTGLLLFTNDGDLTKKLTHPKHNIYKIYEVVLEKSLSAKDLDQIKQGIELEDGIIRVDDIAYTSINKKEIGIELHSGKNRVVRRIFEKFNYKVAKLDRVSFAGLTKKDLPRGHWRFLTPKEIGFLKML